MSDALLSAPVGAAFWSATLGLLGRSSRRLSRLREDTVVPLMGVLAAFVFAAQMVNFTIPGTGSSGHLGGGLFLAIILGPHAAFLSLSSVLTVQTLFFADGGILALGCNIWNLGVYPCFIAYPLIYRPIAGSGRSGPRVVLGTVLAAVTGLQLGALSVVLQTFFSGRSELPLPAFSLAMASIHLAIGLVEGAVTTGIVGYVRAVRPDLPGGFPSEERPSYHSSRVFWAMFLVTALAVGAATWLSSDKPDGLEWSVEKTLGSRDLPKGDDALSEAARNIRNNTALLPDYGFRSSGQGRSGDLADGGKTAAGIIGVAVIIAVTALIWAVSRAFRKKKG